MREHTSSLSSGSALSKGLAAAYAGLAYLGFLGVMLYAIGFVGDFLVPKTIDRPAGMGGAGAVLIDLGLLALFAVQHSAMARPGFKRWWTRFVPQPLERSTYVLLASAALALLFWGWQPLSGTVWRVGGIGQALLYTVFALGWVIVVASTFLINHFDLFGLRQVAFHLRGEPYRHVPFQVKTLYKFVRHPIMLGFVIAFWATPHMSWGHLLFALGTTGYILFGIQLEERDLADWLGPDYEEYRQQVSMLIPWRKRG